MEKTRIRMLGLVGLALLAGCTPTHWVKPGADAALADKDTGECRRIARLEAFWSPSYFDYFGPILVRDRSGRVIYYRPFRPYPDDFFYEQQRFWACMEAKGYRLVEDRPAH